MRLGTQAAEAAVRAGAAAGGGAALPGLIFNASKTVEEPDLARGGPPAQVAAGRLECTMQNLADSLVQRFPAPVRPRRPPPLSALDAPPGTCLLRRA